MKIVISIFIFLFFAVSVRAEDTVKITSLTPPNNSPLNAGQKVKVEVEIEYNLESADMGSITLVIQQAESGHMPLANENDFIQKGKGKITLSKEFLVPDTKGLRIFTPLSPEGNASTTIVDTKMYKVLAK